MEDGRDVNYEQINTGMDNEGATVYKGTKLPVPEKVVKSGFTTYEGPGVCGLCGSYTCSGNCFK